MILVTGGLGFIGAHVARALLDAGEGVVVTRHRRADIPPFLERDVGGRLAIEQLDVTDAASFRALLKRCHITSLVHLAVTPIGGASFSEDFSANLGGLVKVLEGAAEAGLKRVSVASSIGVYMSLPSGPFREDMNVPTRSRIATEAFKKAEEILAENFADRTALDVRLLRLANIYGPLYRTLVNVPSRIAHAAVQNVPGPLPHPAVPEVFADAGNDFCYVKDAADGVCRVHLGGDLRHRVYNIGSGQAVSPRRILEAVQKVVPRARADFSPGTNLPAQHYMDIARAASDVGYQPTYDVDRAMADYVDWLRAGHSR